MKLIKKTPEYWILSAPQLMGRFVGLIFLVVGILGTFYHILPFKMVCKIKQPGLARQCMVYNPATYLFGVRQYFEEVQKAKIIAQKRKNKKSYSLRLYTSDGKHFISKSYNGNRATVKNARQIINQYIQSSTNAQLVIPNYTSTGNRWLMIFFIPFSLLFLYISSDNQLILNKNKNKVTLERKLLGLFSIYKLKSYTINEIHSFEVEEHDSKNGTGYQLYCRLENGDGFSVNAVVVGSQSKIESIAKSLNKWLQSNQ